MCGRRAIARCTAKPRCRAPGSVWRTLWLEAEVSDRVEWERRFLDILQDFQFLPGGRIQAGAGTDRDVTLFNCFVMGTIEDSIPGIFRALEEGAVTMQRGGGVGYDFSTIRPSGARSRTTGAIASGPVSFMDVWDAMCATIQSTGARRGAMMATLRCDHPDIVAFANAKRRAGRLRHFNLSVLVSDAFMQAVERDEDWPLVFPESRVAGHGETLMRAWPGEASTMPCRIVRRLAARSLWNTLLRASYDIGEPGMLFIDRINRMNNLWYCEHITATNPCGEVPLPPYGACDLGAINLTRLIRDPFTSARASGPRAAGFDCIDCGPSAGQRDRRLAFSAATATDRSPQGTAYWSRRHRAGRCSDHARHALRR